MSTVGYGDISPVTIYEKLYVIVITIVGCGVFAYAINTIGTIFQEKELKNAKIRSERFQLLAYLQQKQIKNNLLVKALNYLNFVHEIEVKKDIGRGKIILNKLSNKIKEDIIYSVYSETILQNQFFRYNFSMSFIRSLCSQIQEVQYGPGDKIIEIGQNNSNIYFVIEGELKIEFSQQDKQAYTFQGPVISKNQQIGIRSIFSNVKYKYGIVSKTVSRVAQFNREQFIMILNNFQKDQETYLDLKEQYLSQEININHCQFCRVYNHSTENCYLTQYNPNKFLTISKYNHEIRNSAVIENTKQQERKPFRLLEKQNSLDIQDSLSITVKIFRLQLLINPDAMFILKDQNYQANVYEQIEYLTDEQFFSYVPVYQNDQNQEVNDYYNYIDEFEYEEQQDFQQNVSQLQDSNMQINEQSRDLLRIFSMISQDQRPLQSPFKKNQQQLTDSIKSNSQISILNNNKMSQQQIQDRQQQQKIKFQQYKNINQNTLVYQNTQQKQGKVKKPNLKQKFFNKKSSQSHEIFYNINSLSNDQESLNDMEKIIQQKKSVRNEEINNKINDLKKKSNTSGSITDDEILNDENILFVKQKKENFLKLGTVKSVECFIDQTPSYQSQMNNGIKNSFSQLDEDSQYNILAKSNRSIKNNKIRRKSSIFQNHQNINLQTSQNQKISTYNQSQYSIFDQSHAQKSKNPILKNNILIYKYPWQKQESFNDLDIIKNYIWYKTKGNIKNILEKANKNLIEDLNMVQMNVNYLQKQYSKKASAQYPPFQIQLQKQSSQKTFNQSDSKIKKLSCDFTYLNKQISNQQKFRQSKFYKEHNNINQQNDNNNNQQNSKNNIDSVLSNQTSELNQIQLGLTPNSLFYKILAGNIKSSVEPRYTINISSNNILKNRKNNFFKMLSKSIKETKFNSLNKNIQNTQNNNLQV